MLDKNYIFDIPDGVTLSTNDPLVFEKQVIYVGNGFKKRNQATGEIEYEFSIDEPTIDHWVSTHKKMLEVGLDVPMPEGHTEEPSKRKATALELSKKPDSKGRTSLFAKLTFKDIETAKAFKLAHVSLYSPPVLYHGDHTFVRPIRHIAFTDYPVISGLDPLTTIAASYDSGDKDSAMSLKALATKLGITLANDTMTEAEIEAVIESSVQLKKDVKLSNDPLKIDEEKASLTRTNRELRINTLVLSHKITSAEAKDMKELWAGQTLALSADSSNAFDSLIKTFESRKPIVELSGEQSGGQKLPEQKSALVADAEKRAAQHKA